MSFRDIDSPTSAVEYTEYLNEKWGERAPVMDVISSTIAALGIKAPTILELCCGSGLLGQKLLTALPHISYIGIDQSEHLLEAAADSFRHFGERATVIKADLNQDGWLRQIKIADETIHAVISMQSLHDLGGEAEVNRIYGLALQLLPENGIFINADLIVEPGEELPNNPGRLTIQRHITLLKDHGYRAIECIHNKGGFGCILAKK